MPPLLLGAALIFWGWQTQYLIIAIPIALAYETSHLISKRWNLSTEEFKQIVKLCTLIAIAILFYLLIAKPSVYLIFDYFQWLPVIALPILLAQTYSTSDRLNIRTLFFFAPNPKDQRSIALAYPYFAVCLLSTSAGNVRNFSFYAGLFILTGIALWFIRPRRFSPIIWICLFLIAGSLGFGGHMALHHLQLTLERNTVKWFSEFYQPEDDPLQKTTAIGDIGSVKLSNRIIFRVKPDSNGITPALLRRATYNNYISGMWAAANSQFVAVPQQTDSWNLAKQQTPNSTITISAPINKEQQLLNLPDGTFKIDRLPVDTMAKNQYGTVRVEGELGIASYQVQFAPKLTIDTPPNQADLLISDREKEALNKIVNQLNLTEKSPEEIIESVSNFFQQEFTYSLELANQGDNSTPLSAFLLAHRSGHCEYFATATALLLREVGIPTRYAIGYSVREFSRWENRYIVRERNAHAWTMVYVNNAWQVLDTTPAAWMSIEDRNAPKWGFILDILSWLRFKFSQLLTLIQQSGDSKYWWLLSLPGAFLMWRWFQEDKPVKQSKVTLKTQKTNYVYAGEDSEFYLIERILNESEFTRDRSESMRQWGDRVRANLPSSDLANKFQSILELHYRYRFDPQGITMTEREKLTSMCRAWLDIYRQYVTSLD